MSNYLFNRIKLGDIVSFRYTSPNKPRSIFEPARTIMVLAPNYNGYLHGIKISFLSAAEQEYIQALLQVSYANPQNIFEPLEAQIQARKKELDTMAAQQNKLVEQGKKVIVTPAQNQLGLMDKTKQVLGAVIGKVSTFGRTNVQAQPMNPNVQMQIQKNQQMLEQKKAELDMFIQNVNRHKQQIQSMPAIPKDPYNFYHSFLKSFIGDSKRMKQIYRKYSVSSIKTIRLIKVIGMSNING